MDNGNRMHCCRTVRLEACRCQAPQQEPQWVLQHTTQTLTDKVHPDWRLLPPRPENPITQVHYRRRQAAWYALPVVHGGSSSA